VSQRVWQGNKNGENIGGFMPFCSKCGTEVLEDVKFCSKCGASQNAEDTKVPNKIHPQRVSIIISCVFGILAVFMPWAVVTGTTLRGAETHSINGIGLDVGWLTFGFFMAPLLMAIFGDKEKPLVNSWIIWAGFVNISTGIAAFFFLEDIVTTYGFISKKISAGFGIYFVAFAGASVFFQSIERKYNLSKKLDDMNNDLDKEIEELKKNKVNKPNNPHDWLK
jgi:hypothetical protein